MGKRIKESGMAAGMGFQQPVADMDQEEMLRTAVRGRVREIVRKKKGGAGYVLYSPNKGKKGPPKAVGEFPTRAMAKDAELRRFPPRDPKKLKKARKTVQKMKARRQREGLEGLRARLIEAATDAMDDEEPAPEDDAGPEGPGKDVVAASPHAPSQADTPEEEPPEDTEAPPEPTTKQPPEKDQSRWEQLLSKLSPDAVKRDSRLRALSQRIENQSVKALERAVKLLSREGVGKVESGHVSKDRLGRPYITCKIVTKDYEVGPIYLYTRDELLNVVADGKVKSDIMKLEPRDAGAVRQALKELPHKFDGSKIKDAIDQRDEYLQSLEDEIDSFMSDLDAVELSILKRLTVDKYAGEEVPE